MPITTADFPHLTDDLQEVFDETSAVKVAETTGLSLFDVKETNRQTYDLTLMHGVAGIREVTPGQDLPKVNTNEGDSITYTQRYFGAIFEVTKAMRMFDLYDKIMSLPKSLADDAWDKIDQSMADVLLYGTSSSYTDVYGGTVSSVGPDAKVLFYALHDFNVGSRTYSNVITDGTNSNPALSREAVVRTRAIAARYRDAAGLVRPVMLDTLIVSPENEDLAERIVYSNQINNSQDNDTNGLKGKINKIIVWPRLSVRSDGTDTSAYWFLADSRKVGESLRALFAERPSLDAPEQVYDSKNWEYSLDYFYAIGIGHPAYIFGSTGVN